MKNSRTGLYVLIGFIVIVGAIVPFAAQFILPFYFPDKQVVGAEVWNQYVSIILGIVATITSIVSLVLGFRSEKEANDTERRTRDLLQEIKENIAIISMKQDLMHINNQSDYDVTHKINRDDDDVQINVKDERIN